ncbi:MAG: DegT/DnrJ/EryC1/StrS family aminotransferase [Deltaproteobacteria bacterium]|nr:DegT/DnrJ/EryC1/StrS family aminotransferase [Deltaproteobacteria bacterium]
MSAAGFRREGIGSHFPLDPGAFIGPPRGEFHWPASHGVGLETGRAAIGWLLDALGLGHGDRALLPAYVCDAAVAPFRRRGVAVDFYRVGATLEPDGDDAGARITPATRLLMVVHYFGFPLGREVLSRMPQNPDVVRLEDWVQSPLSAGALAPEGFGEYRVIAWHKVVSVPDSGLLIRRPDVSAPPMLPPLSFPRAAFFGRRLLATSLKAVAVTLFDGAPRGFYRPLFEAAERAADAGVPGRMSCLSRRILERLPVGAIVMRRRENFLRLAKAVSDLPGVTLLRPDLPAGVCPLGLPVRVRHRDGVLARLIRARIYAPVHWVLPAEVDRAVFPAEASLSDEEITLPVDQRYGADEMDFVARTLGEAVKREGGGGAP